MKTNYKLYTLVGLLGLSFTACELKEDLSSVYNKDNAYTTRKRNLPLPPWGYSR